jgi:hypothetical protein
MGLPFKADPSKAGAPLTRGSPHHLLVLVVLEAGAAPSGSRGASRLVEVLPWDEEAERCKPFGGNIMIRKDVLPAPRAEPRANIEGAR